MPWQGPKYTILVYGTDFAINNFLEVLYGHFPYRISDKASVQREKGRYQAQVIFSSHVLDEQLKKLFEFHPAYVDEFSVEKVVDTVKVGICSCDESLDV